MRSIPFLALVGVLSVLLTACPAAGPSFNFTGTYQGIAVIPGPGGGRLLFTVMLIQAPTGTITGSYTATAAGPRGGFGNDGTIAATVTTPGEAAGTLTPTGFPTDLPVQLFLTASSSQDLVIRLPELAIFLERQP